MRTCRVVILLLMVLSTSAFRAEGMLLEEADENNIPGDCKAVAHVLVQLAKSKGKVSPEQLNQSALTLLATKGYKGSFGSPDFIAPFYVGMTLQSPPETDQFMAGATEAELAQLEEEEGIACVKNALIELNNRPLPANEPTDPVQPPKSTHPE